MESEQIRTYVFYILITFIILISILIFINLNNITLDSSQNKKLIKVGVMEAMDNMDQIKDMDRIEDPQSTSIKMDPAGDFCKTHTGSSHTLIESCGKLTDQNCNLTSCCVMLNGKKCVPGNKDGPTFKSLNGEPIEIDYYYYQNKKQDGPKQLPRPKPP
jgi:hypothetical protein